MSMGENHAMAVDSKGKLWCWGQNDSHCLGFDDENQVLYKPTASPLNDLKMKAVKVECGYNHSLVYFEKGEESFLYSVGSKS